MTFVDKEGNTGIARVNTTMMNAEPKLQLKHIGRANQSMQIQLLSEINEPEANVLRVVVLHVSNLGEMTEEEFYEGIDRGQPNSPAQDKLN